MQSSIGKQCFELDILHVCVLIILWEFFGHARFGEGILVVFFCLWVFAFFLVLFSLLVCFVFGFF